MPPTLEGNLRCDLERPAKGAVEGFREAAALFKGHARRLVSTSAAVADQIHEFWTRRLHRATGEGLDGCGKLTGRERREPRVDAGKMLLKKEMRVEPAGGQRRLFANGNGCGKISGSGSPRRKPRPKPEAQPEEARGASRGRRAAPPAWDALRRRCAAASLGWRLGLPDPRLAPRASAPTPPE